MTVAPILTEALASNHIRTLEGAETIIKVTHLSVYYGDFRSVHVPSMEIPKNRITALIGPSGVGKSTVLKTFNRMTELVPNARVEGEVLFHGENIYDPRIDPVAVRA